MVLQLVSDGAVVQVLSAAHAGVRPAPTMLSVTDPEVRPWPVRSYRPDAAPQYQGYPISTKLQVTATTLVSSQGLHFDGDREDAYSVDMGSDVRFIASDGYWDDIGLLWNPYVNNQINYFYDAGSPNQPILNDYTYQIGREVFNSQVLSFEDGLSLLSSFNDGLDDAIAYTTAIALAPRGPNFTVQTMNNSSIKFTPGVLQCTWAGVRRDIQFPYRGALGTFVFIVMSVNPPKITFYMAWSQTKVFSTTIVDNTNQVSDMIFTLGGVGSFDLAEWNLWSQALNKQDVMRTLADLTSIYGE